MDCQLDTMYHTRAKCMAYEKEGSENQNPVNYASIFRMFRHFVISRNTLIWIK